MITRSTQKAALLRAKIVAEIIEQNPGWTISQKCQNSIESYAQGLFGYTSAPSAASVRKYALEMAEIENTKARVAHAIVGKL